jgi:hypothetical protein
LTIPAEALARIEARLQSLRPGKGHKLAVQVNAYKHPDGTLSVDVYVDGEKFHARTKSVDNVAV